MEKLRDGQQLPTFSFKIGRKSLLLDYPHAFALAISYCSRGGVTGGEF
jgi:hypothetical protein